MPHSQIDAGSTTRQFCEKQRQKDGGHAVGRTDRKPALRRGGIEGASVSDDAAYTCQHFGNWSGELLRARCRHHTLGRLQEERVVEQAAQSAQTVTHGRRCQVQALGRARHVALFEHRLEQHEQVEVGAGEINLVQHLSEIVSLDSMPSRGDALGPEAVSLFAS